MRGAMLPALALATAARAQDAGSVQDYHLPPAAPKPSPTAAGPVDTDHPIAAPARPAAEPAPTPTPDGAIRLPNLTASPGAPSRNPAVRPGPAPTPRVEQRQTREATPRPGATATQTSPKPAQPAGQTPAASSSPMVPATPPLVAVGPPVEAPQQPGEEPSAWPWLAGGAAIVLLAGATLVLRRRRGVAAQTDEQPAPRPRTGPEPSPPATLTPPAKAPRPSPGPPPPSAPPPAPPPAADPRPLAMQLEARHLSRALVNATLAYRLTLTNRGAEPLGPLRIAGDIISAHASLAAQDQLTPPDEALATIHEVAALMPGDSVTLRGELRLPIASILPISAGAARVFVPLARFRIEAESGLVATRVFVVGQASEQPGGALRPFPLDRGPGVDRALGQRELELPA